MRDNQSGAMLSMALLGAIVMAAAAACILLFGNYTFVNICGVAAALISPALAYKLGMKKGIIAAAALTIIIAALTLLYYAAEWTGLLCWGGWLALALAVVYWFKVGINGIKAERDYYVNECARIAMTDSITQMRNMHAYLNDAPIYIKIARRYRLTMVVMVIKLKNAGALRDILTPLAFNELLEALSKVMRDCIRLEDLAYFVDGDDCVWCMNMFTHIESVDIVFERIAGKLKNLRPDYGDSEPIAPEFSYGYAAYDEREELTPSSLLRKAIESVK